MKKIITILIGLTFAGTAFAQATVPTGGTGTTTLPTQQILYGSTTQRISSSPFFKFNELLNLLTFTNASSTQITTTNLFLTGASNGCLQVTNLLITSTGSACGSGGSSNWTRFNNSGIYPAISTDQVVIGNTSTSSLSKLEVTGGALIDRATTTSATSTNLFATTASSTQIYIAQGVAIGTSTQPNKSIVIQKDDGSNFFTAARGTASGRIDMSFVSALPTIITNGGYLVLGDNITGGNGKISQLMTTHQNSADGQVCLLRQVSISGSNSTIINGGSSACKAGEYFYIYNSNGLGSTTPTGVQAFQINPTGDAVFGVIAPQPGFKLTVGGDALTYGSSTAYRFTATSTTEVSTFPLIINTGITSTRATTTNATTTNFVATNATTTNLFSGLGLSIATTSNPSRSIIIQKEDASNALELWRGASNLTISMAGGVPSLVSNSGSIVLGSDLTNGTDKISRLRFWGYDTALPNCGITNDSRAASNIMILGGVSTTCFGPTEFRFANATTTSSTYQETTATINNTGLAVGSIAPSARLTVGGDSLVTATSTAAVFTASATNSTSTLPLLTATRINVGSDYITDFTGTGLEVVGGALTVTGGSSSFGYPFPNNATSTELTFNGGYVATNSTTTNSTSTNLFATLASTTQLFTNQVLVGTGTLSSFDQLVSTGDVDTYALTLSNNNSAGSNPWRISATGAGWSAGDNRLVIVPPSSTVSATALLTLNGLNRNVGISTTSPYAPLSVVGTGGIVAESITATSTTATSYFNGSVGIGTSTPRTPLEVSTVPSSGERSSIRFGLGGHLLSTASAMASFTGGMYWNGANWIAEDTGASGFQMYNANKGDFSISTNGGLTAGSSFVPSPRFVVTTGGNVGLGGNITDYSTLTGSVLTTNGSNVGIGTTSPYARLSVVGQTVAEYFTATSTTATSTFPLLSTNALSLNGQYVTSLWGTTTDSLAFDARLAATTTLNNITTLESLSLPLTQTTGTLPVNRGGTGQVAFGQGWLHSDGTTITSSTSPTVATITATSSATSTFTGGLQVNGGTLTVDATNNLVGIGTLAPAARLNVALSDVTTTVPAFSVASSTNTAFIISNSNSNIGIGTTSLIRSKLSITSDAAIPAITVAGGASGVDLLRFYRPSAFGGTGQGLALLVSGGNAQFSFRTGLDVASSGTTRNTFMYDTAGNGLSISTSTTAGVLTGLEAFYLKNATGNIGLAGTTTPWGSVSINGVLQEAGEPTFVVGSSTKTDFIVTQGGEVGVGTTSPWRKLSVVGTVAMNGLTTAAGTPSSVCMNAITFEVTVNAALTCTVSDRNEKNIQGPLQLDGVDAFMKIQPKVFAYKDFPERTRWGFIAQELQAVDPKLGDAYRDGEARSIDEPAILAITVDTVQKLVAYSTGLGHELMQKTKRSAEENWQWLVIGLLALGLGYQQYQIYKLKK